ncbi:MAG: lyase family protein [Devosia sp.]
MKTSIAAVLAATLAVTSIIPAFAQELRDEFYFLDRLNRASLIMMSEQDILDSGQVDNIKSALDQLLVKAEEDGFPRSGYYGGIEPYLIEFGGPDVSRLHTGRSTWDTGATNVRMQQREDILAAYEALIDARQALLNFAANNPDALIPAYTGGVQAQPVSLGHFLTAYAEAYGRHADALESAFATINLSAMGAAALGGSSYPLDRERLSELLGFDRPIHNTYDAVLLASVESQMRLAGAAAGIAITTGMLAEDLGNQYYLARPWLTFPVGAAGSTIMPQKQNPNGVNNTREAATSALGDVAQYMFDIHKTETGHFAYGTSTIATLMDNTTASLDGVTGMFDTLIFHEDRALDQVLDDYATATELANTLQRVGNIPFRDAHHIVTGVVNFGRANGLRASAITFEQFEEVFAEVAAEFDLPQESAGITAEDLARALSPQNMVAASQGLGGPQPASVQAMMEENAASIEQDRAWLVETRARLDAASAALDEAFTEL